MPRLNPNGHTLHTLQRLTKLPKAEVFFGSEFLPIVPTFPPNFVAIVFAFST
ncbi:hypothetical protein LEP1GSC126_0079 [Leptospira kirschneri str. 200801774]|nr:hypothetical protein LEP1GSC126_0079 [Leptospira kirschneri str. 200801774]